MDLGDKGRGMGANRGSWVSNWAPDGLTLFPVLAEPSWIEADHLWARELPGQERRAEWWLSFPPGHGLGWQWSGLLPCPIGGVSGSKALPGREKKVLGGIDTPPVKAMCWGLLGSDARITEEDAEAQGSIGQNFWDCKQWTPRSNWYKAQRIFNGTVISFRHSWFQVLQQGSVSLHLLLCLPQCGYILRQALPMWRQDDSFILVSASSRERVSLS